MGAEEEEEVEEGEDEVAVPLEDPVAEEMAEVNVVAAEEEVVELASASWSCSSSAEADTRVASVSPSTQCLYMSVE